MATVNFDFSEYKDFFERFRIAANGEFKKEISQWFEGLGIEFLRIVEDEIIRRNVVDTRFLLHSFTKGEKENIWEISDGGLTLEVGTHAHYASCVNNGHWTNPQGVAVRFVPGVWRGDKFQYIPYKYTAYKEQGMFLKQQWISPKPYWDSALRIFEKMFPDLVEAKFQQWIDRYFEG